MDLNVIKELNEVVESLTHSGDPSLDQTLMKRLKALCKTSDLVVRAVYEQLMKHMAKDHAEIRLSSFQVCDELFRRSHTFRGLVTDNFQKIITLVCGVDETLPPPKQAAERLKKESLLAIRTWMEKYGDGYPKLKLGYQYLKHNKKVDFNSLVAANEVEIRQREERERRNRVFMEQRIKEIKAEFRDQVPEIQMCIKEMESCFQILMPSFDVQPESQTNGKGSEPRFTRLHSASTGSFVSINYSDSEHEHEEEEEEKLSVKDSHNSMAEVIHDKQTEESSPPVVNCGIENEAYQNEIEDTAMSEIESNTDESEVEWEEIGTNDAAAITEGGEEAGRGTFSAHGMVGASWNITVEVPETIHVVEGEDNDSLVQVLREKHKMMISKYLKSINRWTEWFTKGGEETLLKEAIDLKSLIMATSEKYSDLNIVAREDRTMTEQDEEGESSTINQNPASDQHKSLLSPTREKSGLFSSHEGTLEQIKNQMIHDPTTPQAQVQAASATSLAMTSKNSSSVTKKPVSGSAQSSSVKGDAPTVPFDVDLINWSNANGPLPTVNSIGSLNQFWCEDKDVQISEEHRKGLKCRVISFPGEFQPITRSCRAPLSNGKLCPRKDRHKCPFHGPIVPRDDFGVPITLLPQLISAAAAATNTVGLSLNDESSGSNQSSAATSDQLPNTSTESVGDKNAGKKKGGKKRKAKTKTVKHPGLTDLKKLKDTPKTRIEGKIFNKRTLKRVGHKMDSFEGKLKRDKFSDNFNYALKQ